MPQLNPLPWFMIFMLSWSVFLIILPPKIMKHYFPNNPILMEHQLKNSDTWAWPWY